MSDRIEAQGQAPGVNEHSRPEGKSYLIGLIFAVALTVASFWSSSTT